ncbi:AMP-binding protein [Micromonospora sp. BRA006-A]|nr:AMP-binding protein [Micromonospora sp. BRA006-A]
MTRPAAPFRSLTDRIADQVRATPDATALVGPGGELTYAELDRRAGQLAHHLRMRGVGPEDRVGLRLPRGVDTVVAVLGVWKAGAAFVGLDPDLPPRRLAQLADDAGVRLVLDPETLARSRTDVLPADPPAVAADPARLAYLVYTSGSTDDPRGCWPSTARSPRTSTPSWPTTGWAPATSSCNGPRPPSTRSCATASARSRSARRS